MSFHLLPSPQNNILSLMDMPATQPGAAHVKLCMITVLAIMVLDDPCMEYIRTSRKAHPVFSACLRVLQEVLDMLTPGTAVYRMIPEPRVCLAMAEGLAQAVWGAAYDCCLPGGGNITDEEVGRLSALSFQAMALQRSGLDAGRVIRCLTCTLANMAANEGLAGVMMRSRAKTPPPPDSNVRRHAMMCGGVVCVHVFTFPQVHITAFHACRCALLCSSCAPP